MAKSKDTKRISVTMPEELYIAVKTSAKEDKRSLSQEICHLVEFAFSILAQMGEQEEEGEETPADAIGFKVDPPVDEDAEDSEDQEEDSDCKRKQCPKRI